LKQSNVNSAFLKLPLHDLIWMASEEFAIYQGKSISKLQIQAATYVFELSAENCQC